MLCLLSPSITEPLTLEFQVEKINQTLSWTLKINTSKFIDFHERVYIIIFISSGYMLPKKACFIQNCTFMQNTVEPRYNEVIGTMKIPLLYQVSHYIRVKKQRNIKNWVQQNYLVIRGFCYIRPLYNEVPLYLNFCITCSCFTRNLVC